MGIYLDYAATTPLRREALDRMLPYLADFFGNPSGSHAVSRQARKTVEAARAAVAAALGGHPDEIVFTSGGTEADNLALLGLARAHGRPGGHIITSCIEHKAVLQACATLEKEGFRVTYLPVDSFGRVDPEAAERAVTPDTFLASVMLVNNEVGTLQPVQEIARRLRPRGILVHTDAVQGLTPVEVDVRALNVHALSLSGHKFYGPKGVGALWLERDLELRPILCGGGQERCLRSGTENVAAIVGLAEAISYLCDERFDLCCRLQSLSRHLTRQLTERFPDCRLTGHPTERHPGIVSLVFDDLDGAGLVEGLDARGVYASGASACSAGRGGPSHVLQALNIYSSGSLRFSLGRHTTVGELDRAVDALAVVVHQLRHLRRAA